MLEITKELVSFLPLHRVAIGGSTNEDSRFVLQGSFLKEYLQPPTGSTSTGTSSMIRSSCATGQMGFNPNVYSLIRQVNYWVTQLLCKLLLMGASSPVYYTTLLSIL